MITKHEVVVHRTAGGAHPVFTSGDGVPILKPDLLELERDVWVQMGEPDTLTITVVAGDRLNPK